jgi:methenyltetrahydrofolate cyclohydrolase
MKYAEGLIKKYMEDVAGRKPAPGGGSVAGLAGAAGTALLEMVCNFTLGNDNYKNHHDNAQKHLTTLGRIRSNFMIIIDDDIGAYLAINNAIKTKNTKDIDNALRGGYYISDRACRLSKNAMEIALDLIGKSNPNLITDIGCGTELLRSAFNSSVFNCGINLKGIKDVIFVEKETVNIDILKKETDIIYKKAISGTLEKMR